MSNPQTTILMPREPSDDLLDAALRATAVWLDIKGSALTVNREKMRARYKAMVAVVEKETSCA